MKPLFLTLICLLFVVIGCKQTKTETTATNATPEPPPIAVTTGQLAQKYKENELAADNEFRGKRLAVTGKVKEIKEILGSISVDLEAPNYTTVSCSFPDARRSEAASLKAKQTATLIGTGDGLFASSIIQLDDCRIK